MKHNIFISLLVIFLLFLSGCNNSSDMASLNTPSSSVKNSGTTTEDASAESQAGFAGDTSTPVSSATVLEPAASGTLAAPSENSGSQTVGGSSTSLLDVPDLPNPTQEIVIPAPVPAYTTAENIMNNTLSSAYHGERLVSIHAFDVKNHLTARYNIAATMASFDERYFAALLENADATPKAADRAFILFTDKGRHYIYLDQGAPPELITIWEAIYSRDAAKNMHWLTHMTTSKIVKINFGGWSRDADTSIGLAVEDSATIAEISDFLKAHLSVNAQKPIELFDGAFNPSTVAGLYDLIIEFDNGIRYFLMGYGDYGQIDMGGSHISIYTSDLGKTISYTLNEGAAGHLRDLMEERQIEFWQKNGYPTRMNVKILPANSADSKLVYSKDLKVPMRVTNGSEKTITVTTDFVTRRYRPSERDWEYIPWGEGHFGEVSASIPAKSSAEIEIPFGVFDLPGDGKGKYQTFFWVDHNFEIVGVYVLE